MYDFVYEPLFSLTICIGAYTFSLYLKSKFNYTLLNPLLVSSVLIVMIITFLNIPLDVFATGTRPVSIMLAPATASLGISIWRQLDIIKKNWLPILIGGAVGSVSAVLGVIVFSNLFRLPKDILVSLIPKSTTTAFAINLSQQIGGIPAVTIAAIIVTGITGAVSAPFLIKLIGIKNPIVRGLAIGASSHALGTTKAIDLGEVEGSCSSIAISLCGIITSVMLIFF